MNGTYRNSEAAVQEGLEKLLKTGGNKPMKKYLVDYIAFLRSKGIKPRTIEKYIYAYGKIMQHADFDVFKADKAKIIMLLSRIEASDLGPSGKFKVKLTLKAMAKHFKGEDLYYPKEFAWIKLTNKFKRDLVPDDLLKQEEVKRMLGACMNLRDQAVIALWYETGLRPHELLALKRKNLDLDREWPVIFVPEETKTGARRIPIVTSVPFMIKYIESLGSILVPESPLFSYKSDGKTPMKEGAVAMMLKKVARRAGITKAVYPYLFRHSSASKDASKLNDQLMKKKYGWVASSKQTETYVHLNDGDLEDATLNMYGLKASKKAQDPEVKLCPRCQFINSFAQSYCGRCGSPLSVDIAYKEEHGIKLIAELKSNPELYKKVLDELAHELLSLDRERKLKRRKPSKELGA